ncbi:MAG TPA: hypothetical protein DIW31_00570 [Bacteroidales bacterium]|nr:hypothetical protein [Bacteroidales bacterium]
MANFSEDKINLVWEKARIIDGQDAAIYRQDFAGAWIQRDRYGKEESFGWEIDHMFPESLGGNENSDNLQPLQWENNRTKADNFPSFSTSVSSEGTNYKMINQNWEFNDSFIETLKILYPNNQVLKKL